MLRMELTEKKQEKFNVLLGVDIAISNLVEDILYYSPDENAFEDQLRNAQEDLNRAVESIFS